MKKALYTFGASVTLFASKVTLASAQANPVFTSTGSPDFKQFIEVYVLHLLNLIIPIIGALSLLAFFWGLVKFIAKGGSDTSIAEGRNLMIWGTVALFVMVSVWGIINFVGSDLGIGTDVLPFLPTN